jgi:hypothetical protein
VILKTFAVVTRVTVLFLAVTFLGMMASSSADASQSHYKSGSPSGTVDSGGTHPNNPAHIWIYTYAPVTATVTSGGRYHDGKGCVVPGSSRPNSCGSATGGDYAWDFGAAGNTSSYLTLRYGGYATGGSAFIGYSSDISIYGKVVFQGSWGSTNACKYEEIDVYVAWTDTLGGGHLDKVGRVDVGHLWPFDYPVGSWIYPDATEPRSDGGTGYVAYPGARRVGVVFNGTELGCSPYGPHEHMESFSYHRYGASFERHGDGPDYYYYGHVEYIVGQPKDGNGLPLSWGGPKDPQQGYSGPTSVGQGGSAMSLIGGNTTADGMW